MDQSDEARPSLLVVDDEKVNRTLLHQRLLRVGYNVKVAQSAQEALDRIAERRIDLVVLDNMMPHMSGMELLKLLRASWSRNQLPIIMLTGGAEKDLVASALALGANDYVLKPINFLILHERIEVHLRAKHFKQELLRRSHLRQSGAVVPNDLTSLRECIAKFAWKPKDPDV